MNQPSTLYLNAEFLTLDTGNPRAEAMLVKDGRIVALGTRGVVESQAPVNARRIDLIGGNVIPGFNDCHCHVLGFGLTLDMPDLGPENVQNFADIKRIVAREAERTPQNQWVRCRGYDHNSLAEERHPTRSDLDEVAPNHPVVLWHTSGHTLVCNTAALSLAGITAETETPLGSEIERDVHGEPTGVLKEAPAMNLLTNAIPPTTVNQGAQAIIRAMDVMASQGISSATDADTRENEFPMYLAALNSGRLAGRVTLMPRIEMVAPPGSDEVRTPEEMSLGESPDWLRIGATKVFVDGALTTKTAAMIEPFEGVDGDTGLLMWEQEALLDMICRAHKAGWQIGAHAIGDRGIKAVLDCYQAANDQEPRPDVRHRIEHCMVIDGVQALRLQQLNVVPVLQPGFIGRMGDAYIRVLGMQRAAQVMPVERFDWLGIPVAFSSDRPVIPGAPLKSIRSAVQRKTPKGVVLGREHAVNALLGIRHYTMGSAYASHTENVLGNLVPGKFADFTLLARNPMDIATEDFASVRVEMTVVGGVESFE